MSMKKVTKKKKKTSKKIKVTQPDGTGGIVGSTNEDGPSRTRMYGINPINPEGASRSKAATDLIHKDNTRLREENIRYRTALERITGCSCWALVQNADLIADVEAFAESVLMNEPAPDISRKEQNYK